MANPQAPDSCVLSACDARFKAIDDKLELMHGDFKRLEGRVLNGITERLNEVEKNVTLLDVERDRKDRRIARWETAIISLVVFAAASLGTFLVFQYVRYHDQQQQQYHQQQLKKP